MIICALLSCAEGDDIGTIKAKGNGYNLAAAYIARAILILGAVLPILILVVICVNKSKLHDEKFKNNWGFILVDVKKSSLASCAFHAIFMIRRYLIAIVLVYLRDDPVI